MENSDENSDEEDSTRLIVAITDFLRDQLTTRTDLVPEDEDCLQIAIQCLEMAYGLEADRYLQFRFARPLLDCFNQVTNPVSIRDKLQAEAHKDEGNAYMLRNEFSNAETEYNQAIELDRWNAIYYCNRASARIEQHHYFEAISDCRYALMLNPDYAKAHARMGQAYALLHRPRDAARCFRQALELEPGNERYENNLRVAENQVNRPEALISNLLSSLFGTTPNLLNNAGSTSRITLPTSFMIITESHPPTREDPPDRAQNVQTTQSTENTEDDARADSSTEAYNIVYPPSFGVIDEGQEEESGYLEVSTDNRNLSENGETILIEIHGFDIFPTSDSQIETEEERTETEGPENYREDKTENTADRTGTNDSTYYKENLKCESDTKNINVKETDQPGIGVHSIKDRTKEHEVTPAGGSCFLDSVATTVTEKDIITTDGSGQRVENTKQETDSKIKPEKPAEDSAVSEKESSIKKASQENQVSDDEKTSGNEKDIASRIVEESENQKFPMNFDELQKLKDKYNIDIKTETTTGKDNFLREINEHDTGQSAFGEIGATDSGFKTDGRKKSTDKVNEEEINGKNKSASRLTNSKENEDSVSENEVSRHRTSEEMQPPKISISGRDENRQGNAKDPNVNISSKEKSENKNPDDTERI